MATLEAIYSTPIYNKKNEICEKKPTFENCKNSKGYSLAILKSRKF
ncbi:hypothetical protein T12_10608 [Trichinella patagoniensis]|uniref:Uncharacterized protein n=1 Tax=Trichinella patagoniensis TaxID=990121 RepID=A0A0V0Z499_9BILA|nr:hypothetical protein T12_10608 [Trichinella patagoniensis]